MKRKALQKWNYAVKKMMAVPYEMLLYPELLSNEQLMCIIQEVGVVIKYSNRKVLVLFYRLNFYYCLQRHLRVDNIEIMSREDLIDLFRNYCVPYGQRKYRDTGRGKVLNKTRNFSPEPAPKLCDVNLNHSPQESHLKRERLKPPPEALGGQIKRIRVENNVNRDKLDNIKRKMTIDSVSI